jgi:hypothetical protein
MHRHTKIALVIFLTILLLVAGAISFSNDHRSRNYIEGTVLITNGTSYEIDTVSEGIICSKSGWKVWKDDSQHLSYTNDYAYTEASKDQSNEVMNTVAVPKGQECAVTFNDWGLFQISGGSRIGFLCFGPTNRDTVRINIYKGQLLITMQRNFSISFNGDTIRNITEPDEDCLWVFKVSYDGAKALLVAPYHGEISITKGGNTGILGPGSQLRMQADTPAISNGYLDLAGYHDKYFYDVSGKTAPEVLQQFARWYGVKGFKCDSGIDTIKSIQGLGHICFIGAPLQPLLDAFVPRKFTFTIKNDSLFLKKRHYNIYCQ